MLMPGGSRHGTLEGHVLPGVLFVFWGLWWTLCLCRTRARHARDAKYPSFFKLGLIFPGISQPRGRFRQALDAFEPALKVLLPVLGLFDELLPFEPLFSKGLINHHAIHTLQHVVMYASVMFSGAVDVAGLFGSAAADAARSSAILAGAFAAQGATLAFHLTGPRLDVVLHTLLALQSLLCAAAIAFGAGDASSPHRMFAKCVSLLTLGSFWIHAGVMMFQQPAFDTPEGAALAPAVWILHLFIWAAAVLIAEVAAAGIAIPNRPRLPSPAWPRAKQPQVMIGGVVAPRPLRPAAQGDDADEAPLETEFAPLCVVDLEHPC
ncbi:hypothetical protein M885DRAFT_569315 [Pelagophyceae sp. CCMP2097]|nr:hypothetical protein M885DRAFT_569315 [Pelagophyceae sp. CCMP2097]